MVGPGRLRRLHNDYTQLQAMHERNGLLYVITAEGDPPEHYIIGFHCVGVAAIDAQDNPVLRHEHQVELILTAEYPRMRPLMRWRTPIFHPNFNSQGDVCLKGWYPQQTLLDLSEVLGELIQYKNYNTTSPLNMDAALWAMRHRATLPVDTRDLYTQQSGSAKPPSISRSIYDSRVVVTGFTPLAPPGGAQQPPPVAGLAPFCGQCGRRFTDDQVRICPHCQAARATL